MPSVLAGKATLFYSEEGAGHPVLFAHGIPTDYRAFKAQMSPFSQNFRAIPYSRRHAYPNENPFNILESTVSNNSEDQVGLINALKLQPVHLVGHSYGGFVSLYTAWKHSELLKSLVLVEPAAPSILVENEKNPFQVLGFLLSNPSAAQSARSFQNGFLKMALKAYDQGDLTSATKYFYNGIKQDPQGFEKLPAEVQKLMLDNAKTIGELETEFPIVRKKDTRTIRIPTLLVKGEKSPQWLRAIVDSLSREMPYSTLVEISNSGHLPHIENPSEFNLKVLDFLKKNDA